MACCALHEPLYLLGLTTLYWLKQPTDRLTGEWVACVRFVTVSKFTVCTRYYVTLWHILDPATTSLPHRWRFYSNTFATNFQKFQYGLKKIIKKKKKGKKWFSSNSGMKPEIINIYPAIFYWSVYQIVLSNTNSVKYMLKNKCHIW